MAWQARLEVPTYPSPTPFLILINVSDFALVGKAISEDEEYCCNTVDLLMISCFALAAEPN